MINNNSETIIPEAEATFKDIAEVILRGVAEKYAASLGLLLTRLDDVIALREERAGWESIGKRERTIVTLFGVEIRYKRRGYRRKVGEKTEYWYPLDEKLGLKEGERYCPVVQKIAIVLASKTSYREAALFLQDYLGVAISHQEIHQLVQEAGGAREEEQRKGQEAVYEKGEVPQGTREAAAVVIEADEVMVNKQKARKQKVEIKLGLMHEGWEEETPAARRYRLVDKEYWGGVMDGENFWERGARLFYGRYNERTGRVVINGDGAEWIKKGKEYLVGAEIYLDRYHRNRALRQALGFEPALYERALTALKEGRLEVLEGIISEAIFKAPGKEQVKRLKELKRYLKANWEGLGDWRSKGEKPLPETARGLGASEPSISHVLAARMKKRGMSWSEKGAHHMAQLRFLLAAGKLKDWLEAYQARRWPRIKPEDLKEIKAKVSGAAKEDPAAWLRAAIPLLKTRAKTSALGEVLSALSHIPSLVA